MLVIDVHVYFGDELVKSTFCYNIADTGVGGGKHAGLLSSLQGCGTSHPTIRVGDMRPYAQYGP